MAFSSSSAAERLRSSIPPWSAVSAAETRQSSDSSARATIAIGALSDGNRALLDAVIGRFDARDVAWVAEHRGISLEAAHAELWARVESVTSAREEEERRLTLRYERHIRLFDRLHVIRRLLVEREVVPQRRHRSGSGTVKWPRRAAELRKLDDDSLRELEAALLSKVKETNRNIAESRAALGKPLGTQPAWREIAVLVGLVAASASEEKLKTAQNSVQVRFNRLLKKLGEELSSEDDDD